MLFTVDLDLVLSPSLIGNPVWTLLWIEYFLFSIPLRYRYLDYFVDLGIFRLFVSLSYVNYFF
jgi:hypothetical protein